MTKRPADLLAEKLDQIAASIAADLVASGDAQPSLTEKIQGFKALANYHAMKLRIQQPFDEPGGALGAYRSAFADERPTPRARAPGAKPNGRADA